MEGQKVNDRTSESLEVPAEIARKTIAVASKEAILVIAERSAEQKVEDLQSGLDLRIKNFPLAEVDLRSVTSPWIDRAQLALATLRETGIVPMTNMDAEVENAKRRSWEQWVVIGESYPELDIAYLHDIECANHDAALANYRQRLAAQVDDHLARMSAIRNATLEGALGEVTLDEFIQKVTDQL